MQLVNLIMFLSSLALNSSELNLTGPLENITKIVIDEQNMHKLVLPDGYRVINKHVLIRLNDSEKNLRILYSIILKSNDLKEIQDVIYKIMESRQ